MMPGRNTTTKAPCQRGARFYRCALQVNPHYNAMFRGQPLNGDELAHAKALVAKAVEQGIEVLAITDHSDASGVPAFRAAAENQRVHIFPGFEISSQEGVHVLCLYAPETSGEQLARHLGELGIRNTGPSTDPAARTFSEVLDLVRSQNGLTIAAHATNAGGLFRVLSGKPRIRAWQDENLLAVQIPGTIEDLPPDVLPIVENRNPRYRRRHIPEGGQALAVVNARDVIRPGDLDHPAATCWIKMDEKVSIEGLKQAFLDPGSRIRLNPRNGELELEEHMELLDLAWEGGFFDGERVSLNPNLNVLIGGRGTGKSTMVESIRCALGLDPVGDDARKLYDGIVRHVLRNGTRISLRVQVRRPAVRTYRIERTIPNPPLVRDDNDEVSHLAPADVLPRVEVYGQHELSELSKSSEKLTRLLDRFVERDESAGRRKASLLRELEKNRRALCDVRVESESLEERLAALPGLKETLQRFQDAGLEERLQEKSLLVREERVLAAVPQRIAPFREALETLQRELPIDRIFLSENALKDLPAKDVLSRASHVLGDLEDRVANVTQSLQGALDRAHEDFEELQEEWNLRKMQVEAGYEQILRELQKSRVDGEEFINLRRQIEEMRPLQERRNLLQRFEKEHCSRRRALLAEWEDVKAREFRALDRAARKVSKKLRERVRVKVRSGGDREPLVKLLQDNVPGRMSETAAGLRMLPDLSLTRFVAACRSGAEALRRAYHITPAQAERLAQADEEVLLQIQELELLPTTAIMLNTAPPGEPPSWQRLEDLSTGQKATAVLLLLLLDESQAPLIVDQPEDDLDNRFITEGVVPRIREEKQRRQFIFSTHNANIPVLGDAELILGLSATGEADHGGARIAPEHRGSIDSRPVRELVENILEGGKEAFETRRRKYGF